MGQAADVMRRKIAALNAHDAKETLAVFNPDAEKEVPGATLHGADQVVAYFSVFWEAFPDLQVTVIRTVEEGPVVAILGKVTGTHQGTLHTPGGDIPATGQRIDMPLEDIYEVKEDVIVWSHLTFDQLTLLEQIGVVLAPASA